MSSKKEKEIEIIEDLEISKDDNKKKDKKKKSKVFVIILVVILFIGIGGVILYKYFDGHGEIIIRVQTNERDTSVRQIKVINDSINIRESNNIKSSIIGKVYIDEVYTIINEYPESTYHWYEIETSNGIRGYIAGKYGSDIYVEELYYNDGTNEDVNEDEVVEDDDEEIDDSVSNNNSNTGNQNNTTGNQNKPNNSSSNKPSTNTNNNSNNNNNSSNKPSNNSGSNDNSSSNTNKEEDKKEEEVEKKVIAATSSYTCEDGWTKYVNSNRCYKNNYMDSVRLCPSGYTLEGIRCVKGEDRDSVKPIMMPRCTGGGMLYQAGGQYGCKNGTLYYDYICPSGYKYTSQSVGGMTVRLCLWQNPRRETSSYMGCTDSSYMYVSDGTNGCFKRDVMDGKLVYTCPDGYELKEDKCYEQ